ncbi:ABC transporter ATP-binding protein [Fictibacillus phosphorivorans]|uniref:ABC transporter ATP-binding protein n=1 Tax=Fictibacillus phosphorivorans TaxID=1221500 RepID=UPI00203EC4E3|nr:ABC transporter ATP-binding protein [Fictibacillus phosphorivorans]MCM3719215.1 ABC transporter ATP-binding protein [Fictibacillus phosphorivorans]MCM3776837.1 ABC transporter ATP-binding protein [Fictibacillus phosphorivorans]
MSSVIQVLDVSKNYGSQPVLNNISLNVERNEIYGLLGPSGAGKTTLVKMIAGIETPTSGNITVLDTAMPNLYNMTRIGFMAQSDALYAELSGQENLEFFASIYGLKGTKQRERILHTASLVNLTDFLKKPVHQYSGGMKRRLSLAAALLHEPEVLILDEPTVGIDPVLRQSIWNELYKLSVAGTTILVTTHVMDEAEKCGQLGMLRDGRLIASGSPQELKESTTSATIEEAFLSYGGAANEN